MLLLYPNGKRVYTTYWRCCKSSGAMAIEELPASPTRRRRRRHRVNLFGRGEPAATAGRRQGASSSSRAIPSTATIALRVAPSAARFAVRVRIPAWAKGARCASMACRCDGATPAHTRASSAMAPGDEVALRVADAARAHRRPHRTRRNRSRRTAPGAPAGDALRLSAITRGPLVYATGLVDGYKTERRCVSPAAGHGCRHEADGRAAHPPAPPGARHCVRSLLSRRRPRRGAWR